MNPQAFADEYGYKPVVTKAEYKKLPDLLLPDEQLTGILEGLIKKMHNHPGGYGILFSTNKRVVFFRKSLIGTETKEEYSISKISSAALRKGLLHASIIIKISNDEAVIENCDKKLAQKFVDSLSVILNNPTTSPVVLHGLSTADELRKLADLKSAGILTEEEFMIQKQKLLA